jgi:hypothetical protein
MPLEKREKPEKMEIPADEGHGAAVVRSESAEA